MQTPPVATGRPMESAPATLVGSDVDRLQLTVNLGQRKLGPGPRPPRQRQSSRHCLPPKPCRLHAWRTQLPGYLSQGLWGLHGECMFLPPKDRLV